MSRFPLYLSSYADSGHLECAELAPTKIEVSYIPSKARLVRAQILPSSVIKSRERLIILDSRQAMLTIFPIDPHKDGPAFLQPKYSQVERITIADRDYLGTDLSEELPRTEEEVMMVLEDLPSCFLKDFDSGLGFAPPYRPIVDAIERLFDCREIRIEGDIEASYDEATKTFHLPTKDLESLRRATNRIIDHAQSASSSVRYATAHNYLAKKFEQPEVSPAYGRHPSRRLLTEALLHGDDWLSPSDVDSILNVMTKNAKVIADAKPQKLSLLKEDIELVALDALIARYKQMLNAKLSEENWQNFLQNNSFILGLAFGQPILKIADKPSVGGHKLSGGGATVSDFLVKNRLTSNCALVEIKTPQTKMLNKSPHRTGVYPPSTELSGAVNQALDQKYRFEREIAQIKENTRPHDIESYSVRCCLLVGKMPTGVDEIQSFELYRGNSKNVDIITFDELLEKLKQLRELLVPSDNPPMKPIKKEDLPF